MLSPSIESATDKLQPHRLCIKYLQVSLAGKSLRLYQAALSPNILINSVWSLSTAGAAPSDKLRKIIIGHGHI